MIKDRITYPEFKFFIKKYYKQCAELGAELNCMRPIEVKTIIIGNVRQILDEDTKKPNNNNKQTEVQS